VPVPAKDFLSKIKKYVSSERTKRPKRIYAAL